MRGRTTRRRAALAVLGVLVAACGGGDGGRAGRADDPAGLSATALEGTTWVLDQEATNLETLAPEVRVTARFAGGRMSGFAGCGDYSLGYEAEDRRLDFTGTLVLVSCAPPAGNVQQAYAELLGQVRHFDVRARRLVLETGTEGVALVYRAA